MAQINNGDSCPKREHRAWDFEEAIFDTLEQSILFLLNLGASGFTIWSGDQIIAQHEVCHHPSKEYEPSDL